MRAASPALGGRTVGRRKGASSRSVSKSGDNSSSDTFLVSKNKY